MTLKLFKTACLAYKPSAVQYRNLLMERMQLIMLRRQLIDRMTNILPNCELFEQNAIYPKRYFDDLMVLETGTNANPQPTVNISYDKTGSGTFTAGMVNMNTDLNNSVLEAKDSAYKFSTLQPTDGTRDLNTNSSKMLQLPEIASKQKFKFGFPTGGVNSLLEIKSEAGGSSVPRRPLNFRN